MSRLSLVLALVVVGAAALGGCNDKPSDLREWKPSDHDHTSQPGNQQVPADQPSSGGMFGISEVVLAAWRQNCTTCHGSIGRGDGPQAPMTKPPDLTDPALQSSVSDEDITSAIKNGRGAMPAFALPDSTVEGLVKLVRLLDRSRQRGDAGVAEAGSSDAEAEASAVDGGKAGRADGGARSDAGR